MSTPHTNCPNWVRYSTAAGVCGVQYQYIFGIQQRGSAHSKLTGAKVTPKFRDNPRTGKHEVCLGCIVDIYGEAKDFVNTTTEEDSSIDLKVEPIQAYRTWVLWDGSFSSTGRYVAGPAGLRLGSAGYSPGFTWTKDGVEAQCTHSTKYAKGRHRVPDAQCSCGLYGAKDPHSERITRSTWGTEILVLGACELWGRFVKQDFGWRAQYGRPIALLCDDVKHADKVHTVAAEYEIPVTHRVSLLAATDWGAQAALLKDLDLEGGDNEPGSSSGSGRGSAAQRTGSGTAPCREAARRAAQPRAGIDRLEELKRLYHEGLISVSNLTEVMD